MRNDLGQLLVDIRMSDVSEPQLSALRAAGAQIVFASGQYQTVSAYVAVTDLTTIANLPAVLSIEEDLAPLVGDGNTSPQPSDPSLPDAVNVSPSCPQGVAVSEGDTQLKANLARSTYKLDGSGVKIGALSDSYNKASTATTVAQDIASGDLPGAANPCGFTTPVNVLSDDPYTGATDEGRGMLQIVHDLAPAATLSFATAENGLFSFGDNIRALRTAGADIITDDVTYFAEPFFQEGPVNVAISDVVSSGALYFTSAGNSNIIFNGKNVSSYEAPAFRPTACPTVVGTPLSGKCHNFNPSGKANNGSGITLDNKGEIFLDLQWAEPWYGVTTDLDVYLLNDAGSIVAGSNNTNTTTQTPFEYFSFYNTSGSQQPYRIVINRKTGTGTPRLKYMFFRTYGLANIQYQASNGGDIVGPTIIGHSSSISGFSVAAVPYNDSNNPETYTSHGPAVHYFGPVINTTPASAISPETINQPDFAATDGGCTTFFYAPITNGCYRFFGTSAAAPHAAAVTALLKQRANLLHMTLTRSIIKSILSSSAQPVSGGNVTSIGAGLLNALQAVSLVKSKVYLPSIRR